MEEDTSPIICQAVENDSPRGLTGRNTKQKTSDGIELENTYENRVKKGYARKIMDLPIFVRMHDYVHLMD